MSYLQKLKKEEILALLDSSFDSMTIRQRDRVFYDIYKSVSYPQIDSNDLEKRIKTFVKNSHDGVFCAPFDINSKNYMDIPEETEEWFDLMGDFLLETAELSKQGNYKSAKEFFSELFELVGAMEAYEDNIIFAKRYDSSMISANMEIIYEQYIVSASKSCENGAEFLKVIGLPSVKFYTLRACFATQLLSDGVEMTKVMKIGGWRDIKTMQIYLGLAGVDEKGATDGLRFLPSEEAVMGRVVELFELCK